MEAKRGILLFALGHAYYGRLAHNLAISIKSESPEIPIALIYNDSAISHLKVFDVSLAFDKMIEAPKECYTRNNKTEFIKAKTWAYDLSPFDETIMMDVDTLWLPWHKPEELFEQLKDVDFTVQCRGFNTMSEAKNDYVMWASMDEIRSKYELPADAKYYQVSTEFIYFKKSERIASLFAHYRDNYDNLKVSHKDFAGGIPDELPFAIAMMQTGIYPHQDNFVPIYWQALEKKIPATLIKYYALSVGGRFNLEWTRNQYNRLVQHYFNRAGLRYVWKLQNKRSFLPERKKI